MLNRLRHGPVPVAKAAGDEWADLIDRLAAQFEPKIAAAFRQACAGLADKASIKALADAIAAGNTGALYALLGVAPGAASPFLPIGGVLIDLAMEAGKATAAQLPAGGGLIAFDMLNPATVEHLRTYSLGLITRITEEVREGIREALLANISAGNGPAVTARAIRQTTKLGLTKQQARALANYRAELEAQSKAALDRTLRDKRFDATVKAALAGKKKLTKEQIDKMVARYGERLLAHRALVIARTESIRAANQGAHEAMLQAVQTNAIPEGGIYRRWVVAKDERTCPTCRSIPRMNPAGVGLTQAFNTPWGPTLLPPQHPLCRCTVVHRIRAEVIDAA